MRDGVPPMSRYVLVFPSDRFSRGVGARVGLPGVGLWEFPQTSLLPRGRGG
jgi:hypothetical protein